MIIVTSLSNKASKKLRTKNISSSLTKFAAENILNPDEYSFKIHSIENIIKTAAMDDYVSYPEDIHEYYTNPDKIINERVRIKQIYTISVEKDLNKSLSLNYEIEYSDNNVHPNIIISPESKIPYKKYKPKEIYALLLSEINKIKAKHKILIKIFDDTMKNKLKVFVKFLYQGKFKKKVRIQLFDGIEPEVTKSSKLIKHYLKKDNSHQVIEVEEDELLIEFRKPIFGKNGLNSFGEIVTNEHKKNLGDIEAKIDKKTINIIEDSKKKYYKSKIKGYVHLDENRFYIDNKIKIKKLSRVQDTLAEAEDNNIEVIISEADTNIDSVGEGVELTSETIHIKGHVGAKSTIEAVNLIIDGATHGDSIQEAKFAEINRHKGKLRCHSAKIKLLEGGEIHATNVHVDAALGGSIYAQDIVIGNVKNNLKVHALNSITIKLVSGEDNLFKISYLDIPTLRSKCNFILKDIEDLKFELESVSKHTPSQIPVIKKKINDLKQVLEDIKKSVFDARIIITEPLRGLNTINFSIDEDNELIFKTDAMKYDSFYIEQKEDSVILHPTNKKITLES